MNECRPGWGCLTCTLPTCDGGGKIPRTREESAILITAFGERGYGMNVKKTHKKKSPSRRQSRKGKELKQMIRLS
ncbi:hypothetical protein HMPREF1147_1298 [Selenomonas sp. FOBRC9]|nr:hypothetical protein HMPREF1147_1298 [Selenomonas sp. FOBRC9]